MKKVALVFTLMIITSVANAQFLNSIGITAGGSLSNQKFYFNNPDALSRKKYTLGLNGSIFAEFFSANYVRWVSEIQYNEKGSKDKQPENTYKNKLQYICWNNYLKLRYEMYSIIPYVLVGPRLEYNLGQNTSSPTISGNFNKLHGSLAVGAGTELVSYGNFKPFVEAFYNPDVILPAYTTSALDIWNKNIELRIGLKYEFVGRRETCNTPTYVE